MIEVNGTEVPVIEDSIGWSSRYAIWVFALVASQLNSDVFKLQLYTDGIDCDELLDSGVPLDADRDEVEDFMQEAWDTFLTTYLAEIERSHQIRNPRIVCEDGAWTVVGDD